MKRPTPQPDLFGPVPQPRAHDPEPWDLWLAVLALRKRGLRVYRHGRRAHSVGGQVVHSARRVIAMAQSAEGVLA